MGRPPSKMLLYSNSEYGFTVRYPSSWSVADPSDTARREKLAMDHASGVVTGLADVEVFSVAHIDGGRTRGRLSIRFGSFSPGVYLGKSVTFIADGLKGAEFRVVEHLHTQVLNGKEYEVATYEVELNDVVLRSKVLATAVEGGSLLFGLTAVEQQQFEGLEMLFKTVRFESIEAGVGDVKD